MRKDKDIETIQDALRVWCRFAYDHRWGGLYDDWMQAKKALESLERIERRLGPRQLRLGEHENREVAASSATVPTAGNQGQNVTEQKESKNAN